MRTDFAGKRARYHDYSRELLKRVLLWSKLGTSLSFKICFFQIRKGRNGNTKGDSASKRKKSNKIERVLATRQIPRLKKWREIH